MSDSKTVLYIIAPEGFRDEELLHTKEVLESKGFESTVASTIKGECIGMFGAKVQSTLILEEVNVDDFDVVIFVGGRGTSTIRAAEDSIKIAKQAYEKGKVLCAICWAPTILAKAGILQGKKSTVWVGDDPEYGTTTDKVLEKFGATYLSDPVVKDGKIITADGPNSAKEFGKAISEAV